MEQLSAFVAYQSAAKNNVGKKKSPKQKKQKKSKSDAELSVPKAISQKRKSTNTIQAGPSKSSKPASSKVPLSVQITNGTSADSLLQSPEQSSSQMASSVPRVNGTPQAGPSQPKRRATIAPSILSSINGSAATQNAQKKKKVTSPVQIPQCITARKVQRQNVQTRPVYNDITSSSIENGKHAFAQLIAPKTMAEFMTSYWEKKIVHFKNHEQAAERFDFLKVSSESIDKMLRTNHIEFTKNIDITSYQNGVRETHNPDGRALPGAVWDFYKNGCSIRLINPQTFIDPLTKFSATLQECFHCLVGANVYLTPQNSQGFAPHYDDIEAFVLQIEGKKEWTLYEPRTDNEMLARESSENFSQEEIGQPIFKVILQPGDMLYFPRGYIHQAKTVPNHHSLHITLSVYQKTAFADLFEHLTQQALKSAIETDLRFRRGLPLDIWNQFGVTYSEYDENPRRIYMKSVLTDMFKSLLDHIDIDAAVDKLAVKYQHDALPPVLTTAEKARTTFGTKAILHNNGDVVMPEMDTETEVRLLRAHIVRLVRSDDSYNLYYHGDNSKEYHGMDLNFIEVEENTVDVIKMLIRVYPAYVKIQNLSLNIDESMAVVYSLWDRGLLMTKEPLENGLGTEN